MTLALKKLRPWHEEIAHMWLIEPELSQGEIARRLGKSQYWLSLVVNSDAFKAYYKQKKEEVLDPALIMEVESRIRLVADKAAEELGKRLVETPRAFTVTQLTKVMDSSTRALGMGSANAPSLQQNLYVLPTPAAPATVQEWRARAQAQVVDVATREVAQ